MYKLLRIRQLTQLFAWLLGIFLFCTQSADAQKLNSSCRPQYILPESSNFRVADWDRIYKICKDPKNIFITPQAALPELAKADVVYLGETHDNLKDHQTQLEIIQELYQRNSKIAIAMEMFQRPYQDVIDRYLAGKLSEQDLLEKSEYKQRWGFSWKYYAPIMRFAKQKQLPVLALNTTTEVTRQVSREGLESLSPQQRQFIPPLSEINTDNEEYRQMILNIFKQHQQSGHGASADFKRFFLAQVLWDETMAESIAQFIQAHPDYQVVVLAGQGHIIYGYGIPSRVARRLNDKQLVQRSVLLSSPENAVTNSKRPVADFIWGCEKSDN